MSDLSPGPGSGEDFRTILDRMADGFLAFDTDWRITYANERATEVVRSAVADDALDDGEPVKGVHLWEAVPDAVGTEFYDRYHEAMESQEPVSFDSYGKFEAKASPFRAGMKPTNSIQPPSMV
ncbi:PAS domain-containing protein [Halorubrum yunnanense]|uniref:PAS domain-containing protein n=1 Tax=Halorubrum yunnanense TaxID=1526162 RepID=A0ABD5YJK1_9EURY|nr:PAS domain-containing protein [Halorubrum yunnanense]